MDARHAPLLFILLTTGLRISEAFGLEWRDIRFDKSIMKIERYWYRGELHAVQGSLKRKVLLSGVAISTLRKQYLISAGARNRLVFPNAKGGHLWYSNWVGKVWVPMLTKARIKERHTPDDCRHTYASMMLAGGADPSFVARQLGHDDVKIIYDYYSVWIPERNGQPTEADLIDHLVL